MDILHHGSFCEIDASRGFVGSRIKICVSLPTFPIHSPHGIPPENLAPVVNRKYRSGFIIESIGESEKLATAS